MHTRDISIGDRPARSKPAARQAGRRRRPRPLRATPMVLVTACARVQPARRHRLPAADGRLPRVHLRVGAHPRRLLQARRQADRKGSAHQPPDRSADPAAVPRGLAPRDADHRPRHLGRHGQRLRRAGDHRRLGGAGAVEHPASEDDRRRARRHWWTAQFVINPTFAERKQSRARPDRRRQQGRHRDGRGGRQGSRRGGDRRGARSRRTPPSSRSSPASTTWRAEAGKTEARGRRSKEIGHDVLRARSKPRLLGRSPTRCGSRTSSRTTRPCRQGPRASSSPACRRTTPERKAEREGHLQGLKEKVLRDEVARARQPARRPQVRRDPPDLRSKSGVLPRAHGSARVHARRDPGARHRDARHRRRPAEDRDGGRRDVEALHAPLQLPAVLGRRSAVPPRPRPPRDRPRRAGRARAASR